MPDDASTWMATLRDVSALRAHFHGGHGHRFLAHHLERRRLVADGGVRS